MTDTLIQTLQTNAVELITLGGKIHPLGGAIVAALIAAALIYLGFKWKKEKWEKAKQQAGEHTAGAGTDQSTTDSVDNSVDDFLKDE